MQPSTKREHLRALVQGKSDWSRPLTDEEKALGFLGWHERGYLPHCDFSDLIQLVTFRLADSMPRKLRGEWEYLLKIEDSSQRRAELELYLDRGHGCCCLKEATIGGLMEETLLRRHKIDFELLAWCVMPSHVHVLVHVWRIPLWKLVKDWKRYVAWRSIPGLVQRQQGEGQGNGSHQSPNGGVTTPAMRNGKRVRIPFWQRDYWDTFMRSEEQQVKAVRYIDGNPVRAHLCAAVGDWPFSSGRFRDEYQQLVVPVGGGEETPEYGTEEADE